MSPCGTECINIYIHYQLRSKRFMRATLTSKFLVQLSNTECGGLETTYKDSRKMFRQNVRANLSNFIQDLFWHVTFSNEDFKMVEDGAASLAIVKI